MNKNKLLDFFVSPYFAFLFLFVVLVVVSSFVQMGNDEGMWSYIGRIWNQNDMPPYIYAIENKTPAIFELHYISNLLFGVNFYFVRFLGILSILLTSVLIFSICKVGFGYISGIASMYIFGLVMAWESMDGAFIGQTETFMVLFTVLSVFFVIKAKDNLKWKSLVFIGGIAMSISLAFKQIALMSILAVLALFLIFTSDKFDSGKRLSGILLILLGIITSTVFSLLPLLLSGVSILDYVNGAWLILLDSGSSSSLDFHINQFSIVWTESRIVIFYPFFFLLIFYRDLLKKKLFICLLIWLLLDFVGANLSGHYYGHQLKQVIPSLAIITGIIIPRALTDLKINRHKGVLTALFAVIFFFPYHKNRSFFQGMRDFTANTSYKAPSEFMGEWLKKNTAKKEPIYILGGNSNQVLSYSERISSSKYFNLIFVTDAQKRKELLKDLHSNPPAYIVQEPNVKPFLFGLHSFLENNYKFVESMYGYIVFERR